jgi:predicted transcriptional regulator
MTAKQMLHEYVDRLTDEDAAVTAAILIPTANRQLSADERRAIERGLAEADAGNVTPLEDLEQELGIN